MLEPDLWQKLKTAFDGLPGHLCRIENAVNWGMPDVNGCIDGQESWIELKCTDKWPNLDHFTEQQKRWMINRGQAGGRVYLLTAIGGELFVLLDWRKAVIYKHYGTLLDLERVSLFYSDSLAGIYEVLKK